MRLFTFLFTLFFLATSFALGSFFYILQNQSINFSVLEHYNPGKPTILLDNEGNEWTRFQLDRREPITLSQMPPHLIQAFIAAEDWNFFNHSGVSWRGIVRSTLINLYHRRMVQGASTITQQLVKLLFLNADKTFKRKVKEQFYALFIERQFTKETILQTYLNHIYFGCGIYGVQAACQRFWGLNASQISVDQAATLAGIVRSPASYCPILSPESAFKRRNVVLHSMHKLSCITKDQYEHAKQMPMVIKENDQRIIAPHLRESIRLFLENTVGKEKVYTGGLIVQTTLHLNTQLQAEKIFKKQCARMKDTLMPDIDGALISMDVKTGEIRALIGGYDFNSSKFNRALQAKRQIGSIFKPLIYAVGIENGMKFSDTRVDEPFELMQPNGTVWAPKNYNKKFNGEVTLAYGLSHSSNIIAIKTLLQVGVDPVIKLAKACHISGNFHRYPSLALGCLDTTLMEVIGMFNIFANAGVYVQPHYVKWIKDDWGTKIWKPSLEIHQVLSSSTTSQVAKVLMLALKRVKTFWKNDWVKSDALSKTGTTNDSRTCWYAGSTPELTTVVYIGCDDNKSMGHDIYPIRTAFPIWMGLHSALPSWPKKFSFDPSLHEITINEKTGMACNPYDPSAISIMI